MNAEILIRGTAILAAICYAGRILIDIAGLRAELWQRRSRLWWFIGGFMLLLHVLCAFHFQHGWSHAAAWEHTRQRTLELTGWNSGAGIYFNEAMTAAWLIDVIGWWPRLDWPRRFRAWYWSVQILFAFMVINATAIFGPVYWRAVGVGVVIAVGMARFIARR